MAPRPSIFSRHPSTASDGRLFEITLPQITLPLRPPALAEDLTAPQLAPPLSDLARKQRDESYESHRERDIMHAVDSTLAAALTIRLYNTLRLLLT